jgi:hypothetical protein
VCRDFGGASRVPLRLSLLQELNCIQSRGSEVFLLAATKWNRQPLLKAGQHGAIDLLGMVDDLKRDATVGEGRCRDLEIMSVS